MQDAVGEGPVVFFTQQGRQVVYDLSSIRFDGGVPKVPSADAGDQPALTEWLQELVKQRRLSPAPDAVPPPVEVLRITAKQAGEIGNSITVDVATGSAGEKVNVTVTWTFRYRELTLATLEDVLGSSTNPATGAGLAQVKAAPGDALPVITLPFLPVVAGNAATWAVPATQGTSFTLEPRSTVSVTEAKRITVGVSDVKTPQGGGAVTFTLTAIWKADVEDVTSTTLDRIQTEAGFAIEVVVPPAPNPLPAIGTITLRGGTETLAATKARATILAQQ